MLVLVTGGAASGKSHLAEEYCQKFGGAMAYIATMQCYDRESEQRIAKHRQARSGKGFDTVERPDQLAGLCLPQRYDTGLLECLSNLVANEMFGRGVSGDLLVEQVMQGIQTLGGQLKNLVVVTNEVFADGVIYDEDTQRYLDCLGRLNCVVAQRADVVIESVCGIGVMLKGKGVV